MSQSCRWFIALLPPQSVQAEVNQVKQYFSDRYDSRAAQKSPPHMTLQPPFEWPLAQIATVEQALTEFAQSQLPLPIVLDGYGAFPPRVIYMHVHPDPKLLALQSALQQHLANRLEILSPRPFRAFVPHLTVAFRDLSRANFESAWADFQGRSLHYEFVVRHLTLLRHDGQCWMAYQDFPLAS